MSENKLEWLGNIDFIFGNDDELLPELKNESEKLNESERTRYNNTER